MLTRILIQSHLEVMRVVRITNWVVIPDYDCYSLPTILM